MNWLRKILGSRNLSPVQPQNININQSKRDERRAKVERAAEDFADRFEGVMKELANK